MSDSGFQLPKTIRSVIQRIHKREYVLPAIQREFVWKEDQIIRLFDSIMKGYPIGSFLFWNITKESKSNYEYYDFIKDYHERDKKHNPKASDAGENGITAILDGQQRLTALYIGLKGTYATKKPYKRWDSIDAFPEKKLYLNLLSKSNENDLEYEFKFLTQNEARNSDNKNHWFEVSKVLEFQEMFDVNQYIRDNNLLSSNFADKTIWRLYQTITEKKILNYYLVNSQELDKVLNIFIRVNSGGTQLSYSDLLLSIATAEWEKYDAREEITNFVDSINDIGRYFTFTKDFVLKNCLVLSDIKNIAFKVDNFKSENMKKIEKNWNRIKESIKTAILLVSNFGYNYQTLVSTNAVIPIAYYIFKNKLQNSFITSNNFRSEREKIRKWLTLSLIKKAFSGTPDSVLSPIRDKINESDKIFPIEQIISNFKGEPKSLIFSDDDIKTLLDYKYNQKHTFTVLSLLYPTLDYRNMFHMDHIFPKSMFTWKKLAKKDLTVKEEEFFMSKYNLIGNLQLLEGAFNQEKGSTECDKWLTKAYRNEEERAKVKRFHNIPNDISLEFTNFKEFFNKREEQMLEKFKQLLQV